MKALIIIGCALLAIIIGTGAQIGIVWLFTLGNHPVIFEEFNLWQWLFQGAWWLCLAIAGFLLGEEF